MNEHARSAARSFTALPYLQPGAGGGPLIDGQESIVLAWQTNNRPAEFAVTVDGKRQ